MAELETLGVIVSGCVVAGLIMFGLLFLDRRGRVSSGEECSKGMTDEEDY